MGALALRVTVERLSEREFPGGCVDDMRRWIKPDFSRRQVNLAGETLRDHANDVLLPANWDYALNVISNWRSSHSFPLHTIKMGLRHRARQVDAHALVAQRLKRMSSIQTKLENNGRMALSQMQDIGGCRAVTRSIRGLKKLIQVYDALPYAKKNDYVERPKVDGYRSVHYVMKYTGKSDRKLPWADLRVEVQLRSRLQHAWATAVETVDIFSQQSLKVGGGDDRWRRFFSLMSGEIALRERTTPVHGTPTNREQLREELREWVNRLNVIPVLEGWYAAVQGLPKAHSKGAGTIFLLMLDVTENTLHVVPFANKEEAKASKIYLEMEDLIRNRTIAQVVLVEVQSLEALPKAFPNYFADTRYFINAIREAVPS